MSKNMPISRGLSLDGRRWIYGLPYSLNGEDCRYIIELDWEEPVKDDKRAQEVRPETVSEHIMDLSGVGCYLGDIIQPDGTDYELEIVYDKGCYGVYIKNKFYTLRYFICKKISFKIVGNIYE